MSSSWSEIEEDDSLIQLKLSIKSLVDIPTIPGTAAATMIHLLLQQEPKLSMGAATASSSSAGPQLFAAASSSTGLPFKEIIALLKDCYDGKFNQYLQEILKEAELVVEIQPQNPMDPNSRKELQINLKVAATAIDKYASILAMVLGSKEAKKPKYNDIIGKSADTLKLATTRVKRIEFQQRDNFVQGLKNLNRECSEHISAHFEPSCFALFCARFNHPPRPTVQYQNIIEFLDELGDWQLNLDELLGAVYDMRYQIITIKNTAERNALRDCIDLFIKNQGFPAFTDKSVATYQKAFKARAATLGLTLPEHFAIIDTPTMALA